MEKYLLDYNWTVMAPELTILVAAALLTVIDLLMKKETDRRILGWMGIMAVATAGAFTLWRVGKPPYEILSDTYRVDDFALAFKLILLAGTALVLLAFLREIRKEGEHVGGEYIYLLLTALLGGMILTSSADLITLFVGLELLSLSSYVLACIRRKRLPSNEAAWKYFITGSVSSAFILYGMSFVYGLSGTTNLYMAQKRLYEAFNSGYESFVLLSLFLMLLGFGFKVASAPFHMWVPDVYQGAPTPVTAFLAVVSKTAAFAFVLRVLLVTYLFLYETGPWQDVVGPALLVLSAVSMVVGNTGALRQSQTKRLMAYSSVAHAGYLLVPLAVISGGMLFESTVYYLMAYLLMTLGAFTVLNVVEQDGKTGDVAAFAGLSRRNPLLAVAMTVFLVSLAGIPVTAGFFGKFYILIHAITGQTFWIAAVMVITTVISYFYYFKIIRMMYFRPSSKGRFAIPFGAVAVILVSLTGTIFFGLFPQWTLDFIGQLDWVSTLSPVGTQHQ
ncbi:NADH-quinone oxidoreductase subunit N [Melghirimyces algeriensis]|uniref:NADH-quinone oxidoreductase subunit N n=1 Tax=Melghirimyces algeriensis TaxID=910412 RepID=A0A521D883_9BACL|nr:NADH-quinone oxidoreductase subunit N [Melghirimyces algeriensis]SMO67110.1 NADH-quinone oxidoreductase subunit N [Melghirimyces algeriensis]